GSERVFWQRERRPTGSVKPASEKPEYGDDLGLRARRQQETLERRVAGQGPDGPSHTMERLAIRELLCIGQPCNEIQDKTVALFVPGGHDPFSLGGESSQSHQPAPDHIIDCPHVA